MDRYRAISARFSRRRIVAIAVSFAGAVAFVFIGGDFTPAAMRGSIAVALVAVLLFPLTQTIALRRALAPVRRAIATGQGDAHAIAGDLRRLPAPFAASWLLAFFAIALVACVGGNLIAGQPLTRNIGDTATGAVLCWAMYATLLGLAFEHALADYSALAADAVGGTVPRPRIALGGIAGRIALVIIVTVGFVTAVTVIIGIHGGSALAYTIIGLVIVVYGILAAIFLAESIAAPLARIAHALDRVAGGDLDALAELRALPRVPHEAGVVLHALAGAETSLRDTSAAAVRLAGGDLATHIEARSSGDFLGRSLATLLGSVRGVLGDAGAAAGALSDGSARLDANAGRLRTVATAIAGDLRAASTSVERLERATVDAGGASIDVARAVDTVRTAADALEDTVRETAAALEQLARSVDHSTEIAGAMRALAQTTVAIASDGAARLADADASGRHAAAALTTTLDGIESLDRASARIGDITATIEEIANQTNLLALNAAIEAARAGEHGRGFAVVADEIRGLADRAATATAEIAAVIRDVQKQTAAAVTSTRDGQAAATTAHTSTTAASTALDAIQLHVADIAAQLEDADRAAREQHTTTQALTTATTAVRDQASRNREVAANLGSLAQTLAQTASEGAAGAGDTKQRVTALLKAGETVATEAAAMADLTAALKTASTTLNTAIAHFSQSPHPLHPPTKREALSTTTENPNHPL